ncbi:MAG: MFS transporter [Vulcanibacillus sp.]
MSEFKIKLLNRNFLILLSGRFISQLGDKLYLIALPWLVLDLTHSAVQTSLTLALEMLPLVIFAPFVGVYVDRKSRKKLMVISDWIRGLVILIITLLAVFEFLLMPYIYLAAILLSTFTLLFDSASQGYLPDIVPNELLFEANTNLTFVSTTMRLIGPILAGILIGVIGAINTVGLNGVSFILSAIILSFLPKDNIHKKSSIKTRKILEEIKEGFQYLFQHEILLPIAIFSTFMNVGIYLTVTLFIFESKEILGYTSAETSIIFWVSGVFATITTLLLRYIKELINKGQIIRYGSIIVLFSILLLVFKQSLVTFTISYSLILIVGIAVNISMTTYRQEIIPNHLFGRVMTSSSVLVNAFTPFVIVISGWIAMNYGSRLVFELAAAIIFINVIYARFSKIKNIK